MWDYYSGIIYSEAESSMHDPVTTEKDFDEQLSSVHLRPLKPDFSKSKPIPTIMNQNQSPARISYHSLNSKKQINL
jgi:hypothetical protein